MKAQSDNSKTFKGHATIISLNPENIPSDLDGYIEKKLNPDGDFAQAPEEWLKSQKKAKTMSDEIRRKGSTEYFVPETKIINGRVFEQRANGQTLEELEKEKPEYIIKYKQQIINALAHFINDMSELKPIKTEKNNQDLIGFIPIKHVNQLLQNQLPKLKNIIPADDIQNATKTLELLQKLSDSKVLVWGHNDIQPRNIIVDTSGPVPKIAIIDFEACEYKPKFESLYARGVLNWPEIWNTVNKLPRKTNPDLHWNYDKKIADLRNELQVAVGAIKLFSENKLNEKELKEQISQHCKKMRELKNEIVKNRLIEGTKKIQNHKTEKLILIGKKQMACISKEA